MPEKTVKIFKDQVLLDSLLENFGANIAQFVSFGPNGKQRLVRIKGVPPEYTFKHIKDAVESIFKNQRIKSVNIRTFLPNKPEGNPFVYGIMDSTSAEEQIKNFLTQGYYVIVNETIPVNDGGFSGVVFGDLVEVASNDTPRCVEKPGTMALPRSLAIDLIKKVYGFTLRIPFPKQCRVEFSIHPTPVGYNTEQQVVWQAEEYDQNSLPGKPKIIWPHRYSQDMGDKAFGLLIADLMGFPVPFTQVVGRLVPQFQFGHKTYSGEPPWIRTCPKKQIPGLFRTSRGWIDPFAIMYESDPDGTKISSLIIQDGIKAEFSGSAITDSKGKLIIEGKRGYGDTFMIGEAPPDKLPGRITRAILSLNEYIKEKLGDIRFEWVYDCDGELWIVQLHVGKTESWGNIVYPGDPSSFFHFNVEEGIEKLRTLVEKAKQDKKGVIIHGEVGITSHYGDILRKAKVPSRIEPK